MAGASKTSSRARVSTTSKHQPASGITTFLTPTGQGRHAYVRDTTTGKNPNLATDSDEFIFAIAANAAAGHGPKIRAELDALADRFPDHGWDDTRARLEAAGALDAQD